MIPMPTTLPPIEDFEPVWKRIDTAKVAMMCDENMTFYSALLSNMEIIVDRTVPTAATNGLTIWFNPEFVMYECKDGDEVLGLIMHENDHTVYEHMSVFKDAEIPNREHKLHNIACDHYINIRILKNGYKLPGRPYADKKYKGMSSMQIFNELRKDPPPDLDDFVLDIVPAPPDMTPEDHAEAVLDNIHKAVVTAQMAGDPGSIPGDVLLRLEDALNPQLPWQCILQQWMCEIGGGEYTWSRPNRRYTDIYLPSRLPDGMEQITTGTDVSCSMDKEDLSEIQKEQVYMWETIEPERFRMMTFDTKVQHNKVYEDMDSLDKMELVGGGGTNIQPLIDSITEEAPEVCVIFTDGEFAIPDCTKLVTELIWVIYDNKNFKAPVGRVIFM